MFPVAATAIYSSWGVFVSNNKYDSGVKGIKKMYTHSSDRWRAQGMHIGAKSLSLCSDISACKCLWNHKCLSPLYTEVPTHFYMRQGVGAFDGIVITFSVKIPFPWHKQLPFSEQSLGPPVDGDLKRSPCPNAGTPILWQAESGVDFSVCRLVSYKLYITERLFIRFQLPCLAGADEVKSNQLYSFSHSQLQSQRALQALALSKNQRGRSVSLTQVHLQQVQCHQIPGMKMNYLSVASGTPWHHVTPLVQLSQSMKRILLWPQQNPGDWYRSSLRSWVSWEDTLEVTGELHIFIYMMRREGRSREQTTTVIQSIAKIFLLYWTLA